MQIASEKVNTVSSGGFETVLMGLNPENLSQAAHMFRNQIYSYVYAAVVREYICNAIDEHNTHGIQRPIEVTLDDKEFKVRDFALGLPKDKVLGVFFQYLASTKTGGEIGGFGIGAKAALAYTDLFYVSSFHNGEKTVYAGGLEDRGGAYPDGVVKVLTAEPCNESGIEVSVPIKNSSDKWNFQKEIQAFTKFSKSKILFNGELIGGEIPEDYIQIENLIAKKGGNEEVCVRLGEVLYKTQENCYAAKRRWELIICSDDVNVCSVPPSREQIKMDEKSRKFIESQIKKFKDKIAESIAQEFEEAKASLYKTSRLIKSYGYEFCPEFDNFKTSVAMLFDNRTISSYYIYNTGYAQIKSEKADNILFADFIKVVFHYGLPKIKRNFIGKSISGYVYFVEVNNKAEGEKLAKDLDLPAGTFFFQDDFVIPKTTSVYERNLSVKVYKANRRVWDVENIKELDELPFIFSYRGKTERKLESEWYDFDHAVVPQSLKSFVKGWPNADEIAEEKKLDFQQKVRDNLRDYVEAYLVHYNGPFINNYTKVRGLRRLSPKIDRYKLEDALRLEVGEEIKKEKQRVLDKLVKKADTFEFRVLSRLTDLPKSDFDFVRKKISK